MDPYILELCLCTLRGECQCQQTELAKQIVIENATDTARALNDVIVLCGVPSMKASLAIPVILNVLINYDEEIYRIDLPPKKAMRRNDLFLRLGSESHCSRLETQLIYSVVKRAFRALYYCTGRNGIYNVKLEARCKHGIECMWSHAAKKTAQIYNKFEGFFQTDERMFELKIKCIYKNLLDRLKERYEDNKDHIKCLCQRLNCFQKIPKNQFKCCQISECQVNRRAKYTQTCKCKRFFCHCFGGKKIKVKCHCEKLECSCNAEREFSLNSNCDQGPYKCRWVPHIEDTTPTLAPLSFEVCTLDEEERLCECESLYDEDVDSWFISSHEEEEQSAENVGGSSSSCKRFKYFILTPEMSDSDAKPEPMTLLNLVKRVLMIQKVAAEVDRHLEDSRQKTIPMRRRTTFSIRVSKPIYTVDHDSKAISKQIIKKGTDTPVSILSQPKPLRTLRGLVTGRHVILDTAKI